MLAASVSRIQNRNVHLADKLFIILILTVPDDADVHTD